MIAISGQHVKTALPLLYGPWLGLGGGRVRVRVRVRVRFKAVVTVMAKAQATAPARHRVTVFKQAGVRASKLGISQCAFISGSCRHDILGFKKMRFCNRFSVSGGARVCIERDTITLTLTLTDRYAIDGTL